MVWPLTGIAENSYSLRFEQSEVRVWLELIWSLTGIAEVSYSLRFEHT